jgi:hypothetical protein
VANRRGSRYGYPVSLMPRATFTFQLIKAISGETELGYDGDRSACFR